MGHFARRHIRACVRRQDARDQRSSWRDAKAEGGERADRGVPTPLRGATAGAIDSAYDSVGEVLDLSVKVAVKARRDYDLFKEEFEIWLESKRTSAREALEIEKAEKGWKKQITDGMVMDQVRATWPDEYSTRANQLKSFQATAHFFEARPDVVKQRARALDGQREIMLAKGGR